MKVLKLAALAIFCFLCSSCSVSLTSQKVKTQSSLDSYKYFYLSPDNVKQNADLEKIITECLVKRGFTKLNELAKDNKDKSLVINYNDCPRNKSKKVSLQFINAGTYKVVGTSKAKGRGNSDDIKEAINNSLDALFQ